ncbi:MAG: anti-sigma factor [Pseudomonadota bacterium]
MGRADERDIDAAERALGVVPRGRESAREAEAREAWEMRFAGLAAVIPPVAPPPGLFGTIETKIQLDETVVELQAERRRRRAWRRASGVLGAVAAVLLAFVLVPGALDRVRQAAGLAPADDGALTLATGDGPVRYVALVRHDDDPTLTGLVVQVDPDTGELTLVPTRVAPPENSVFEVWHLPGGEGTPRSLGLFPEGKITVEAVMAQPGDTFSISAEPLGGSPDGYPSEPLFHGTLTLASF